jgi:S1-C subfamily serine protease
MVRLGIFIAAVVSFSQLSLANYSTEEQGFLGVKIAMSEEPKGFKVEGLVDGGPAEKAGIKAEDVITKMDKKDFETADAFVSYVRGKKPGDKIAMTVIREKKEMEIEVTVGKAPDPN